MPDWSSPSQHWCLPSKEEGPESWRTYGEREADQPRDGVTSSGLSRIGPLCCVETDTTELETVSGANENEQLRFVWIKTRARRSVEARTSLTGIGSTGKTGTSGTGRLQRRMVSAVPTLRLVSFHCCPSVALWRSDCAVVTTGSVYSLEETRYS